MVRTSRTLQAQSSVNVSLFALAIVIALEEANVDKNANRVNAVHADSRGNKDTMVQFDHCLGYQLPCRISQRAANGGTSQSHHAYACTF